MRTLITTVLVLVVFSATSAEAKKKTPEEKQAEKSAKEAKKNAEKAKKEATQRRKNLGRANYMVGPPRGEVWIKKEVSKPNSYQPHVKIRVSNFCSDRNISIHDENGFMLANLPAGASSISVLVRRNPAVDSNMKTVLLQAETTIGPVTFVIEKRTYQLSAWDAETRLRQPDTWDFCSKPAPPESEPGEKK